MGILLRAKVLNKQFFDGSKELLLLEELHNSVFPNKLCLEKWILGQETPTHEKWHWVGSYELRRESKSISRCTLALTTNFWAKEHRPILLS